MACGGRNQPNRSGDAEWKWKGRKREARRPCGPLGHDGLDLPVRLGAEKGAQYSGLTWAVYVSSSLAYECRMRHVHRPCLDTIKVPSFFTLSSSHQFLDAYMEH